MQRDLRVAVRPDGTRVYFYNSIPARITVVDATNNTVVTQVPLPCTNDSWITISPDGAFLYIACNVTSTLQVMSTATNTLVGSLSIPGIGNFAASDPAGTRVYVANQNTGNIIAIDTATDTVIGTFSAGIGTFAVGVHPVNGRIYVLNQFTNTIHIFEPDAPVFTPVTVVPITTPNNFLEPRISGRFIGPAPVVVPPAEEEAIPSLSMYGLMALSAALLVLAMARMR